MYKSDNTESTTAIDILTPMTSSAIYLRGIGDFWQEWAK